MEQGKTVRQIAGELGMTKQALEKRLAREPLHTAVIAYVRTENRVKYVTEEGERIIRSAVSGKRKEKKQESGVSDEQQIREVIALIRRELEEKDAQIARLQEELEQERQHGRALEEMNRKLDRLAGQIHDPEQNKKNAPDQSVKFERKWNR